MVEERFNLDQSPRRERGRAHPVLLRHLRPQLRRVHLARGDAEHDEDESREAGLGRGPG